MSPSAPAVPAVIGITGLAQPASYGCLADTLAAPDSAACGRGGRGSGMTLPGFWINITVCCVLALFVSRWTCLLCTLTTLLLWMATHAGLCRGGALWSYLFHRTGTRSRQVPTLDSQILTAFLARIGESDRVGNPLVQRLGEMLGNEKLPRTEDLVQLYAACSGGDSA